MGRATAAGRDVRSWRLLPLAFVACTTPPDPADPNTWPVVYAQDFTSAQSLADFVVTDPDMWQWGAERGRPAIELLGKSDYRPPHRSPLGIALVADVEVRDFDLDVELLQTGKDYGHRDMCLFLGFASPDRFYYVHLATTPDPNAHNVFVVDGAPRKNLLPPRTQGVDWGRDQWHHVRIERRVDAGTIRVFWDGSAEPILAATDTRLDWGRIGFGSFDDSGLITDVVLRAPESRRPAGARDPFSH